MIVALRAMTQVAMMIGSTTNEERYGRLADYYLDLWLYHGSDHDVEESRKSLGRDIGVHEGESGVICDEGLLIK